MGQWDFVSLLIGVNNQYRGLPLADYARGFEALLTRAIALAGLWPDIRNTIRPEARILDGNRIEVPVGNDGHYQLTATGYRQQLHAAAMPPLAAAVA